MASASKPGRLFDSVVSRHFDDYAKEVATSEPKGLQWKLNWTMHDHGATTLHLAAALLPLPSPLSPSRPRRR